MVPRNARQELNEYPSPKLRGQRQKRGVSDDYVWGEHYKICPYFIKKERSSLVSIGFYISETCNYMKIKG
jgi:hypothetical protein